MHNGSNRLPGPFSLLAIAMLMAGANAAAMAATAPAAPSQTAAGNYAFNIAQQPLPAALNAFSAATGWQVGLPAELAQGISSPGARGAMSPERALDRLLLGTNLSYRKLGERNVVLERSKSSTVALQQVTVSATRQAQSINSVPNTVTVKDREQLDRDNVNSIRDLVRYEPGVSVGGAGQRAGTTGYNIRGIDGNRILTQVDGVGIPDSFFSGPYAQTQRNYVDPEIVKRVEILRGPSSVLYGSNAIGGTVSYYTLDAADIIKPGQDAGARLKTGYSSADESWLTSGTVAARQGDFDALLHLSQRNGHEAESYGSNNGTGLDRTAANPQDARTSNLLAKLGWNYADDARLAFTYEKYKDDRDTNQKSAVGGPFISGIPMGFYTARKGNDTITRERFGINHDFGLQSAFADHVKWSLNYQIAKTDQTTEEIYFPRSREVFRTRETTYKDRQWVFDAQFEKAFSIASTDHQLTYGTTLKHQKVTGSRSGTATCTRVIGTCRAAGAPSPVAGDSLLKSSDFPDPTVNTYSLFAQDQISWNNWTFLPGARYDYTQLTPHITDAFLRTLELEPGETVDDSNKTWHRLSPSFGVTYSFNDNYTWYGQYAEGFRTPTAKSLYGRFENTDIGYTVEPNPNLDPEKSKSYETGLRGQFEQGNFDIAVFYNKYRDFIDENALTAGYNQQAFQAQNIKHATIRGAEAKGRLNLDSFGAPEGLYTQGSIAYQYGRNDDTGEPLNSVNPLTGVLGLGYEQPSYGGALTWTVVKKKNRVDSNTFHSPDGSSTPFKTPGFGTLDLAGFYKVTDDVTVSGGIYNLTDKKYWLWNDVRAYDSVGEAAVTQPASIDRLSQPGRNFAINLVWDI